MKITENKTENALESFEKIIIDTQGRLTSNQKIQLNQLLGGSQKPTFLEKIQFFFDSLTNRTRADDFIRQTQTKYKLKEFKKLVIKGDFKDEHKTELNKLLGGSQKPTILETLKSYFIKPQLNTTNIDNFIQVTLQEDKSLKEESLKEVLSSIFNITQESDSIKFMAKVLSKEDCLLIANQLKNHPFLELTINNITNDLKSWDSKKTEDDLKILKETLTVQTQKLNKVTNLFTKLPTTHKGEAFQWFLEKSLSDYMDSKTSLNGKEFNRLENLTNFTTCLQSPLFKPFFSEIKQGIMELNDLKENSNSNQLDKKAEKALTEWIEENENHLNKIMSFIEKLSPKERTALASSTETLDVTRFDEEDYLKNLVQTTTTDELRHQVTDLKEKSKNNPITKIAIEKQALLFKTSRETKEWAKQQSTLKKIGDSQNEVFKVTKSPELDTEKETLTAHIDTGLLASNAKLDTTIGFYKEGAEKEEASSVMEELMWEVAVIMGFEGSFAPTKKVEIELASGETRKGGLQPSLDGTTLVNYWGTIPKNQIIQGTMISLILGMGDAHAGNIIIGEEGHCQFFDNTRTLLSSNHTVQLGNYGLLTPYKSGFLGMKESYEELSEDDLHKIKNTVTEQKEKMVKLRAFFENPMTQQKIKKLPPGWLDVKASLDAMQERLDSMEKGLNNKNVKCLRDLVFCAFPEAKFVGALTTLKKLKETSSLNNDTIKSIQADSLDGIGYSLSDLLDECVNNYKIDPQFIKDLCDDSNLSFEEILTTVFEKVKKAQYQFLSQKKYEEYSKSKETIISKTEKHAVIDLKDISRSKAIDYLETKTFNMLMHFEKIIGRKAVIYSWKPTINTGNDLENKKQSLKYGEYIVVENSSTKPSICTVFYKDKDDQIIEKKVSCTPSSSTVKIEGFNEAIEIEDLKSKLYPS